MTRYSKVRVIGALLLWCADGADAQLPSMQPVSGEDCVICHLGWVDAFNRPDGAPLIDKPPSASLVDEQACLGCHDGSVGDSRRQVWIEHGHKTGIKPPARMKVPSHLPLDEGRITCRTCHTAHAGTGRKTLAEAVFLRMPNDASQLCEACHVEHVKGPELGTHPVGGMPWPVPEELIAAGARVGPDKHRLICQTCHMPHGSHEDHLLVMGTQSSQLCQTCHHKLRPGLWQQHDMAREHPQNPPLSTEAQRQAIHKMGTQVGPGDTLICLSCHKLHHGRSGRRMLADTLTDSQLCVNCHPTRATMFETAHDLRQSAPNERNRLGQTPAVSGPCGACHSFHQFARQPDPQPLDPTGLCTTCHQQGRCAGNATGMPFPHPAEIDAERALGVSVPLFDDPQAPAKKSLGCLSCHDPHAAGLGPIHLLRETSGPWPLCLECHQDVRSIVSSMHSERALRAHFEEARLCAPCHVVHAQPGEAEEGTWSGPLGPRDQPEDVRQCTGCHAAEHVGEVVAQIDHPEVGYPEPADPTAPGYLPLVNEKGELDDEGRIGCITCHQPHGAADASAGDTERQMRATKVIVRPYVAPNLCTNCHGFEGLLRYLYFHQPEKHRTWALAPLGPLPPTPSVPATRRPNDDSSMEKLP